MHIYCWAFNAVCSKRSERVSCSNRCFCHWISKVRVVRDFGSCHVPVRKWLITRSCVLLLFLAAVAVFALCTRLFGIQFPFSINDIYLLYYQVFRSQLYGQSAAMEMLINSIWTRHWGQHHCTASNLKLTQPVTISSSSSHSHCTTAIVVCSFFQF